MEDDPLFFAKLTTRVLGGRAFQIKTEPCIKLFSNLQRWLSTGMLGAIVYGRPRLGKTSAARWVLKTLPIKFGNVPWIEVPARRQNLTSERAFFQHILHCANSKFYNIGTTADKRDRLREALVTRARKSPIRTVIIFFDEAQLLDEMHYSWLVNISNELELDGFRAFFLLIGQHQLCTRRETFVAEGIEEVVGRFMTECWSFPGIGVFGEFENCLIEFDAVEYPEGEGIAFVAQFVPKAYAAGWRLTNIAKQLWDSFNRVSKSEENNDKFVIPMHYFCSAVINLLEHIRKEDNENLQLSNKTVNSAVERSGFVNAQIALRRLAE